ncbi:MAG TPA: RNA polymerase-associated protein RapA [Spongiibacteraceae bacterium]|nr:RNA polymerase-associated protein RapA [Spongiibacteraceae bacterium]
MNFVVGQRWLSHADPQLGLGIITAVETRRINVLFPAVEEERTYSLDNAPLSRITFRIGDQISVRDELELTVTAVEELRGLLMYTGIDAEGNAHRIAELQLSAHVQLHSPQQRLSSGQCDSNALFALRLETLEHLQRLQQSTATGLIGARTSLLPHQVYIAQRVAQRHAPRVLLADEVGLGKTIEAGMIVHQQLLTGRAQRVLLLLPTNLQHQWLVEMLRRFNLRFALFDAERYDASLESGDNNPFESEQLVLCAIDWLAHAPAALQHALAAHWDLTVVDEAHHLHWSEEHTSIEYNCVEQLAARSAGLILLTATPEQAGIDSHFARLRLLDPARFHDLAQFKAEAARYPALNNLVQQLLAEPDSIAQLAPQLRDFLNGDEPGDAFDFTKNSSSEIIQQLLDRHGTGRVLFRNTRAAVQGFPERRLHARGLLPPDIYAEFRDQLYPELHVSEAQWLKHDPRATWLEQLLKTLRPAKVLVICAHAQTAIALEQHLHLRAGIRSAAFHEGLTLLERDRAAAWFADTDLGAQTLVCSEIGSEGRNFQFAQHLVLFDLPNNPDLLEQRIGRLDRIGQGAHIDIHVPYLENSAQQVLFRWYHEGLDAFQRTCAAGFVLYERHADTLQQQMRTAGAMHNEDSLLEKLLQDTAHDTEAMRSALEEGRDALLELNSCNKAEAQLLIDNIVASEQGESLRAYMECVWDNFGVDHELHSQQAVVVRPSEQMLVSHFPELSEEGFTATFDRAHALARDDMEFLSWEHPHARGVMEMIVSGEYGNAAIASITVKGLPPGTLLLETVYSPHCPAPRHLQIERYLPATPLRFIVDRNGKNLSAVLPHAKLNALCSSVPRQAVPAIIGRVRTDIGAMQEHSARIAAAELPKLVETARAAMTQSLQSESERLAALHKVNPAIRMEEIEYFRDQLNQGLQTLTQAKLQLQALRLIVTT